MEVRWLVPLFLLQVADNWAPLIEMSVQLVAKVLAPWAFVGWWKTDIESANKADRAENLIKFIVWFMGFYFWIVDAIELWSE